MGPVLPFGTLQVWGLSRRHPLCFMLDLTVLPESLDPLLTPLYASVYRCALISSYVVVWSEMPGTIAHIRRNSLKILVIEDNQGVAEVVSLALELRWPEARILIAETGESGLLMLESENPNLVILDIGLPGIDGFEVLKATRTVSDVPVIMLTARVNDTDVTRALDLGADDYITKPFSHLVFLARVQAVIRRSLVGSEASVALAAW